MMKGVGWFFAGRCAFALLEYASRGDWPFVFMSVLGIFAAVIIAILPEAR